MNTGCLPEINVRLWQSRRTCSRLELRGWGYCLMVALNRRCCRNQPSCSPLCPRPLPSGLLGQAFGNARANIPAQKADGLRGDSLVGFPTQLHKVCAIPGGSGVEQREARGRRRAESRFPTALPS